MSTGERKFKRRIRKFVSTVFIYVVIKSLRHHHSLPLDVTGKSVSTPAFCIMIF